MYGFMISFEACYIFYITYMSHFILNRFSYPVYLQIDEPIVHKPLQILYELIESV